MLKEKRKEKKEKKRKRKKILVSGTLEFQS
jgi:hypothetical protein